MENVSVEDYAAWLESDECKHRLVFQYKNGSIFIVDIQSHLHCYLGQYICQTIFLQLVHDFAMKNGENSVKRMIFLQSGNANLRTATSFYEPDNSIKIAYEVLKRDNDEILVFYFILLIF